MMACFPAQSSTSLLVISRTPGSPRARIPRLAAGRDDFSYPRSYTRVPAEQGVDGGASTTTRGSGKVVARRHRRRRRKAEDADAVARGDGGLSAREGEPVAVASVATPPAHVDQRSSSLNAAPLLVALAMSVAAAIATSRADLVSGLVRKAAAKASSTSQRLRARVRPPAPPPAPTPDASGLERKLAASREFIERQQMQEREQLDHAREDLRALERARDELKQLALDRQEQVLEARHALEEAQASLAEERQRCAALRAELDAIAAGEAQQAAAPAPVAGSDSALDGDEPDHARQRLGDVAASLERIQASVTKLQTEQEGQAELCR